MKFNEIFEKTVYAFEHNEVYELLNGEKGYAYQAPMIPVAVPTHDEFIFRDGIYPYYKSVSDEGKEKIQSQLVEAIRRMIDSENEVLIWWALSLLFGQKLSESKYKTSPFLISTNLIEEVKPRLLEHKEKLEVSKQFDGGSYDNGLWGDVLRYNNLFKKHFNYSLLG